MSAETCPKKLLWTARRKVQPFVSNWTAHKKVVYHTGQVSNTEPMDANSEAANLHVTKKYDQQTMKTLEALLCRKQQTNSNPKCNI
jgi:glutamine phosphoribosylpyrophosphate amidotransferase